MAKRIVISGGSGFIGKHLVAHLLKRGDEVVVLSRHPQAASLPAGASIAAWDPRTSGHWQEVVDGATAVVHLAGSPAVGVRLTEAKKRQILESRTVSARHLVDAVAKAQAKPDVFVSASGINYYGARPKNESVDEQAGPGSDFLAGVCIQWEAEAARAAEFGVREVRARTGVVLGAGGGALKTMAVPFKFFAGGPIGSGEQIVSWIHLDDAIAAYTRCIDDESIEGPVNLTAPNPVSNRELSDAIGQALHRPNWLPAPSFALKAAFKEGAAPLLTGQRVLPRALQSKGFQFRYEQVQPAVTQALSQTDQS